MGTITHEGGACGGGCVDIDGADSSVVDAEKQDGEAYSGDSIRLVATAQAVRTVSILSLQTT